MISTDGVQHVIHPRPVRCLSDDVNEVLRVAVDGRSTEGADDVDLSCGRGGPDAFDARPSTQLQCGGSYASTPAMNEHRIFGGQVPEMMQHVVRSQVGHRHGRRGLQPHTFWNADDAFGCTHQMTRVRASARHGDDAIAHVEVLDTISDGRNGSRSLVTGREGIRWSRAVQAKPLQQIGEVDARIGHVNGHLTGTWRGCLESLHTHRFGCPGFGEHQSLGHREGSGHARLKPPSNCAWVRQNGFERARQEDNDEHLIP